MRPPSLPISLSLAVLLSANVLAQDPVKIQFQINPVVAQTGSEAVFTVLTLSQVFSMEWQYKEFTLGLWSGGTVSVNNVPQFSGRITITATQLRIGGARLEDSGTYTVIVVPFGTAEVENSILGDLRVFEAVANVNLVIPTTPVEGRNMSLLCTYTPTTGVTVQWGKGGVAIVADSRISISDGSLVINPARRNDTGEYTCTVSNPISAQSASKSLTVFYGPDAPVLTKDAPKDCVGGGDVLVGETIRLICLSDSLPPALFSWQFDGQPVTPSQPDSGVLDVQTFSSDESGRYVCTARNSITGGTSEQGTELAIVDTCLNGGEVAGIVIGCLLLLIIIALLIWLIVLLVRKRRRDVRQEGGVFVRESNPSPRPEPPDPQPNGARHLYRDPNPPLYPLNTRTRHSDRLNTAPHENSGNLQTLMPNGLNNPNTQRHNGSSHTNRLPHGSLQNITSYPQRGIDNPAFTHIDAQDANTQQQNPNILIQTGLANGGAQPPAVQLSLNALPQSGQQIGNAQLPTIHVNLNSYPATGQQTQQENSFPFTNTAVNNMSQAQQHMTHPGQSWNPRMQSGQAYDPDPRLNGHLQAGDQGLPDLIPTGFSHHNRSNTSQRNANTQTYRQEPEPRRRSDRHDTSHSSSHRQMPWDRLRGTPAYPGDTPQRGQVYSDTTDYTTHPPVREERPSNRSQTRSQSQTTLRSRAPSRDVPSLDRRPRSRSSGLQIPVLRSATPVEAAHHKRRRSQRDIRGSSGSHSAPRQETRRSNNPQARPLMNQQSPVVHSAVSHGPVTQHQLIPQQGADTRAWADPNHLPQAHVAQQPRAAPNQQPPQGLVTQTQPVLLNAHQPRREGPAPAPHSAPQPVSTNLTQAALKVHTDRAQTFQNRQQQTQAALFQPGPQVRAPAEGAQHPPTPPPVIPLAQFQSLPKKGPQHRSPLRGPQPPRPPVNMPVAQRHQQVHHRPTNHHHQHGNPHIHATAHRHGQTPGHRHPGHSTHPHQQQTHRGRPR